MATRYAVATGNWSSVATWDGGTTLPTNSDDVYADGKTVTIDQDVTILSLRTTNRGGGTAGGGFTCSGAYTIAATGTGILAGASTCLTLTNAVGTTTTVNAACTGSSTTNSCIGVLVNGAGTVNITGAVSAGTNNTSYGVHVNAAATLTITGSITGASAGSQSYGMRVNANATITITGDVSGGAGTDAGGIWIVSNSPTMSVTGSVTGSATAVQGSGIAIDTGAGSTSLTVTGTITSGAAPGIGQRADAIKPTIIVSGPFIGSTGTPPIASWGTIKLTGIANNEWRFLKSTGGTTSLWSSDVNSGAPSAANVRSGTKFGVSNEFTGTLRVPDPQSVLFGVPTDATVGTASIVRDPWLSPL